MARIPDEELERLKREVSVQRLAEARGVKLKGHGKDLLGLCPFHDDREPSLVITPGKNLWHCLGACGEGGSVVDWVMRAEGVSFRHAVELLRSDRPAPSGAAPPVKQSTVPKLPAPVAFDAEDAELLEQVVAYYHQTLKEEPKALKYLGDRGLLNDEAIERFRLGYANRTLGYRLPEKNRKAGAEIRGRLQRLGIYRESGHEHFNGCLVVPVFDEAGRVVEIYGRKIAPRLKPEIPRHLYLPGPHRGVWNWQALQESKEVILCEALLDALSFWCAGYRHVTAAYGTEGFTGEHLEAFRRHGTERVLIAFDRDDAGDRAAAKAGERLAGAGIGCYRVLFPRGMDANEYAGKVEPARQSLGLVLRNASWMGEGEPPVQLPAAKAKKPPPESAASESPSDPPLAASPAPSKPPPATPAPAAPATPSVPAEVSEQEVVIRLGDRRYRVRGLGKNLSYDVLRVNLLAARGGGFHVDTLDLYVARQRAAYVKPAAEEMRLDERVVKADLGKVLLKLEELQEKQIRRELEPGEERKVLTAEERSQALELLSDPQLLDRILEDFTRCGVVGEETNKLVGYLAAVSRKLDEPLAVILQSSSAAGKTALMEAVLSLMPEEERVQYSAMTGQSLFYMAENNLTHKILAVVEEEGAERASYALKLLQSEGELTIASTGKDPQTGRLVTHEYRVEGPVAIFLTTTAVEIDEELLNRCLVLTVDEEREQTRAIHRLQRERRTLEGLRARRRRKSLVKLHRNAQRLLRPLAVVNPYAPELTFLDTQIRTRRDHEKYLTLIDTIALVHQHQRPVQVDEAGKEKIPYLEVKLADIEAANRLAHEVLGRSLDELPPQTRRLLTLLDPMVVEACEAQGLDRSQVRFTARQVREATGWGQTQVKVHLRRLVELEYLLVHRGERGHSFVYELVYDGEGDGRRRFLPGLIDVEALRSTGTIRERSGPEGHRSGPNGERSGSGRPRVGPRSGGGRGGENEAKSNAKSNFEPSDAESPETAHLEAQKERSRRRSRTLPLPLAARAAGGEP
jgi:DNA primase